MSSLGEGLGSNAITPSESPRNAFDCPPGFKLHVENSASILLPDTADAFLNPVQEFNRDLSVACITSWSEEKNDRRKERLEATNQLRKAKGKGKRVAAEDPLEGAASSKRAKVVPRSDSKDNMPPTEQMEMCGSIPAELSVEPTPGSNYRPQEFVILEALSATGLRSIRYAKEIPNVKYVIANDLSPAATAAMQRNVNLNGLGPKFPDDSGSNPDAQGPKIPHSSESLGKVRINEGDACDLMYSHRSEKRRVDVVDLDPYGTAAPFIDAAIQCVKDDGLLCVTCTDLSVLASGNYPEKCFSNYGGVPAKAEYSHEVALRLVLHTLATSAARYGRYISPLISLSIDFYVRLFVRVQTAPVEVKKTITNTALYHICHGCQSFNPEPLGRVVEKKGAKDNTHLIFKTVASSSNTDTCEECGGRLHVAGPMWSGPIHDPPFVERVLHHVESNPEKYGTFVRMKGMLTLASEELETPFYFTTARIASHFHCQCPPLDEIASAILHAGYPISRSHASAGSIKSTAPRSLLHDIMRTWVLAHPVKLDKIKEETAKMLLSKPIGTTADFTPHPGLAAISSKIKLVRYPTNPANWGPGSRPTPGKKPIEVEESDTI